MEIDIFILKHLIAGGRGEFLLAHILQTSKF